MWVDIQCGAQNSLNQFAHCHLLGYSLEMDTPTATFQGLYKVRVIFPNMSFLEDPVAND